MIIKSIRVQNFRCIRDETLPCDKLTALIGPNGSGKSSFLRALDMFYAPSTRYTEDDFYDRDTSQDIIITVSFTNLTEDEKKLFQKYIEGGKLTVEKEMKWPPSKGNQKYYSTSLQNPEFDSFRTATGANLRREYNKLREDKYSDLSEYTNKDDAEKALRAWEESHADQCLRRRDEGQFFGFKEVGEAHLERFTRFIPVPAVHDASEDAVEGKGTPLTEIMDLVVRSVLAHRKEIIELQEGTQKQYEQIVDPTKLVELQTLEHDLSSTLKTYVPDAGVKLIWLTGDVIEIPMPSANIKLVEDEYPSSVERTGHGLQRAFILTMLQHLAVVQAPVQKNMDEKENEMDEVPKGQPSLKVPNLIIGIEEPELYQHPNRQRHLSKILLKLATGSIKGVAGCTQIIYTTHSPLFVDITRFDKVRRLHKICEEANKPKQTKVFCTNLDEINKIIGVRDLEPRIQTLMTPWMNEGFFADVAVVVEGTEDRAVILEVATTMGYDLESMGISVIPCQSKNNLIKSIAIFSNFKIPVYAIWDSDYENEQVKRVNHKLLRLFNHDIEDWPEKVTENFACFKHTIKETLRTEIDKEFYDDTLNVSCDRLCLRKRKDAFKNPLVIHEIIKEAQKKGKSSKTLENIISQIVTLTK